MPLTCYCPHTGCAAKIPYEAVKPTRCPRCSRAFADAFRVVKAQPVPEPEVDAGADDLPATRPLTKSALLASRKPAARKPRPVHTPVADVPAEDLPDETEFEEVDDGVVDSGTISRRARQLAASIDPSSIVVNDQDEGVFRFAEFWESAEAQRARANQAQPKGKAKSRRR